MNSRNQINQAVRYALMAGAAAAVAMPTAFAQDQGTSTSTGQNQQSTAQLGKIEVTGTRIKRTDVETAQPVTIVTQKEIQATGLTTVGDILQNLTQAGNALNTLFNNGGNGETRLDLRNLGSNRVLILVNGRRWIPGLGGSVDVNAIPASVIDHVEILQDGASAVYGSDAIAGVINFITVKNYNGAEASAYIGMYDGKNDGGGWDGKQQEYNFTIGSSGDRAGVVMNIDYTNQAPIWAGQRTMSKEAVWTQGGGSSASLGGRYFLVGPALAGQTIGSGKCAPYNPPVKNPKTAGVTYSYGSCDLTTMSSAWGTSTPTKADLKNFGPSDKYNYAPSNYLVTPNERTSAYVQGHYDLADNLTFSTEVLYNQRNSNQTLAPSPLFLGIGNYTDNGKFIGVGAKNPYNPFGMAIVGNSSEWCVVQGNCATNPNELALLIGRRPVEGGNRVFNQNVSTYQFNAGFKGYFNMLGSEWDWDLGYNFGAINEFDSTQGLFNTGRLDYALSDACVTDPTCVPFNIFGGAGSITPNMVNYTQYEEHNTSQLSMRDYTGNITGDIGDWFGAGSVGLALGAEYLENDGYNHPDATTSSGNTTGNTTQPTNGRVTTKAEYLEINIPILADMAFAKSLSLDLADRHSSFNWKGGTPGTPASLVENTASADTARWAIKYQPVDTLLLRASWSQGFRTPSISDLYFGNSSNYPKVADPCAGGQYGGWDGKAADLPPGCGGAHKNQPNGQIMSIGGGNPGLTPEKAVSKTVGFVWNPNFLPGFDFSADYYNIKLMNEVGTLGAQNILNGCYYQTHTAWCKYITVNGGIISKIMNTNVNSGELNTSGIDVSTHYKLPSTSVGDFKVGLDWTFLREFESVSGIDGSVTNSLGLASSFGGFPRQKATIGLNWNYGDWSANWDIKYIHSIYEQGCSNASIKAGECSDPTAKNPDGSTGLNHLGAWFTHNVQVGYHVESWNTDLSFGIRNLFDKQPPAAPNAAFANTYLPALYPIVPGRFFYGRVSVKF
ncbi:MAG TPA: TonB-dependent receptor [Gammaproteobacteria bacterium]|nr:TonB-dependent receptor [Gammaproteobacteria bacterium]